MSDASLIEAINNGFVSLTDKNGNPLNTSADALAIIGTGGLNKDIEASSEETITLQVRVIANVDNDIISHVTGSYTDGKNTDPIDSNTVTASVEKTIKFIEKSETLTGSNVVIVLDRSGSMSGDKFKNAKTAAKNFINKVFVDGGNSNNSTISVYTFGTKDNTEVCERPGWFNSCERYEQVPYSELIGSATTYAEAQTLIATLNGTTGEMNPTIPWASDTPYYIALEAAYNALYGTNGITKQAAYADNANSMVFLTDGKPEGDNVTERRKYAGDGTTAGTGLLHTGTTKTTIYTVGYNIKNNSDEAKLLKDISKPDGKSFILTGTDSSALNSAFDAIHAEVSSLTNPTTTEKGVAEMASPEEMTVDRNHPILISVNETEATADTIVSDGVHEVIVFKANGTKVTFNTLASAVGDDNYLVMVDGKYELNAKKFEAADVITVRYFVEHQTTEEPTALNLFRGKLDVKNAFSTLYDDFGNLIGSETEDANQEIDNEVTEVNENVTSNDEVTSTEETVTPEEEPTEVVETPEVSEEPTEEVPETITELPVEVEPIGEVVSVEPIVEETNSTEVVEPEESEEE